MQPEPMRLMVVVGSTRPGRTGLPIAEWVRDSAMATEGVTVDFADLAEVALPFLDEPNHPRLRQYTKPHTLAWSARVEAADAVLLVTPEYNYSYSPVVKNALDFLSQEWWRKPVGFVSYGGVSSGTRGVAALLPVITALGMVRVGANVELPFAGAQIADGVFAAGAKETAILAKQLGELAELAAQLRRSAAS